MNSVPNFIKSVSVRVKQNYVKKIENHNIGSATSVFQKLMCRSVLNLIFIRRWNYEVVVYRYAIIDLITFCLGHIFKRLACIDKSIQPYNVSIVPYRNSLVVIFSNSCVISRCALLCLEHNYTFLLTTCILLRYCWYFLNVFIIFRLIKTIGYVVIVWLKNG